MAELEEKSESNEVSEEVGHVSDHDAGPAPRDVVGSGDTWTNKSGWGRSEAVVIASLGAFLLLCIGYLFLFVNPGKSAALARRDEVKVLEKQLLEARDRYGRITSTEEQVARLIGSADRFESEYLPSESAGKTSLYKRVNDLITANGLINTAGPSYRGLDLQIRDADGNQEGGGQETSSDRLRSIFPGVLVSVTVDGSYSKVRNFLRQLEMSEQFIVISSVALEPSDRTESASQGNPTGGNQSTKSRNDVVSLKIEFAAYFRRASGETDFAPAN
jgi:hypothetical protein